MVATSGFDHPKTIVKNGYFWSFFGRDKIAPYGRKKVLKFFFLRLEVESMNKELLQKKIKYIPLVASGQITYLNGAKLIGISDVSVFRLVKRYRQYGDAIFIHGNCGKPSHNKKYDYTKIAEWCKANYENSPWEVAYEWYCDNVQKVSYSTVYRALKENEVYSPKAHAPVREKQKHLPRKERPCEGELIQIDGSKHEWFIGQEKTTLHGAIDDATHKVLSLYMCKNECLLGYMEMLRQIIDKYGIPKQIYSDRSACFFVTKKNLEKVNLQEQLKGNKENQTQWQKMAHELNIELIAALSPQAKGRIERLWQTLQGRLPYIFRFLGITTIDQANEYLKTFVDDFNARFAVEPQSEEKQWRSPSRFMDLDFTLSVQAEKKTNASGNFIYHGEDFHLDYKYSACKKFVLCLNERYGLRGYMNGHYHPISLVRPLGEVVGDSMPQVERELIYEYLYSDTHSNTAVI